MNLLEGLALLAGIPVGLLLAGYWLVARLRSLGPVGRLAAALPAGVAVLLLFVSIVNFFRPLEGAWAYFCLLPCLFTLAEGRYRRGLAGDLHVLWRDRRNQVWVVGGCIIVYLGFLLWPMIRQPDVVFYDGTSNHDSFFWITLAEYLKRHTYMQAPVRSAFRPLTDAARAITGLLPVWGRMGSEGLLAVTSSVVGAAPLKIYVYGTISLYFAWLAGVFLVLKTFVADRLDSVTLAAAVLFQPVFIFFQSNSNLPNLIGILVGTLLIVAVARLLARATPAEETLPWMVLTVFGMHALLCSYPEMVPFVLFPVGLLWLRGLARRQWRAVVAVELAVAAGFVVNWVTTVRAVHGFIQSFISARADAHWGDLFHDVTRTEMPSALTTLVPTASIVLGSAIGAGLVILLAVAFVVLLTKARDRLGLCMALGGSLLLLAYTIDTHFIYGWQKTVEFGGIVIAAVFPAGCIAALRLWWPAARTTWRSRGAAATAGLLVLFYGFATWEGAYQTYYWAKHKQILSEVFDLRDSSLPALNGGRVLVISESFLMSFFHSMWSTYCLPRANLVFSGTDPKDAGGYLRPDVRLYQVGDKPPPTAVYESRAWADSFDANSARLLEGESFAVLRQTNYVLHDQGLFPDTGPPRYMALSVDTTLLPHSKSWLHLDVTLRDIDLATPTAIDVSNELPGTGKTIYKKSSRSAPPWRIDIPLRAGVANRIRIALKPDKPLILGYPLLIKSIKVTNRR